MDDDLKAAVIAAFRDADYAILKRIGAFNIPDEIFNISKADCNFIADALEQRVISAAPQPRTWQEEY